MLYNKSRGSQEGVLEHLIAAVEQQEVRAVTLAYFSLLVLQNRQESSSKSHGMKMPTGCTLDELAHTCETLASAKLGAKISFDAQAVVPLMLDDGLITQHPVSGRITAVTPLSADLVPARFSHS